MDVRPRQEYLTNLETSPAVSEVVEKFTSSVTSISGKESSTNHACLDMGHRMLRPLSKDPMYFTEGQVLDEGIVATYCFSLGRSQPVFKSTASKIR